VRNPSRSLHWFCNPKASHNPDEKRTHGSGCLGWEHPCMHNLALCTSGAAFPYLGSTTRAPSVRNPCTIHAGNEMLADPCWRYRHPQATKL
jgi:hypothetical protein